MEPREQGPNDLVGVEIPLRDGKSLVADIWLPARGERYPTVLMMTPYGRKKIGGALPDPDSELDLPDQEHYAYVLVDWRGFFDSKPAAGRRPATMADHGKDGYDVVEWIAKQEWSNGKVGMWGPSALGRVQYAVAANKPPHLECIVPMVAPFGYRYEQFYTGGVLREAYVELLGKVGYGPQRVVKSHPTKDDLWRKVETSSKNCAAVNLPTLVITGWYDFDAESVIDTYREILEKGGAKARRESRLIVGPWRHAAVGKLRQGDLQFPNAAGASASGSTAFLDHHLRGTGGDKQPRVRYFQMGSNRWLEASTFPPPKRGETKLYLGPDRTLSAKPAREAGRDEYQHDPDDPSPTVGGNTAFLSNDPRARTVGSGPADQAPKVEQRADSLVYTSAVLEEDVELTGAATAELHFASDCLDTDVAIRLCDVFPDGRSILICDGIQRMRYRNSASDEELLEPGEIYKISVATSLTSYAFQQGHRIRLIVSSANYPRFAVNKNVDRWRLLRGEKIANNQVHRGGPHPSQLVLPR
ncbi:MAG: CocE/NonD family hydrolase [Planctomycetota bacterium]